MPNAANELLILGLLIIANGTLTAAETAVVSARKARLRQSAEAGSEALATALAIAENPGRFLGLVQFWLTLACVVAGMVVVSSVAREFESLFARSPALAPWAESIAIVAATLVLSSVMLVFGELLPKRIALANPERAAIMLGPLMRSLVRILGPFSSTLGRTSDAIAGVLGFRPFRRPTPWWTTMCGPWSSAVSTRASSSARRRRWSRGCFHSITSASRRS
jgi:putative hemolysin